MKSSVISVAPDNPLLRFTEALQRAEEEAGSLGVQDLSEALGATERLKAKLWARLYDLGVPRKGEADRLLDVEEAARVLTLSPDTLYRRASELPFTVRLGGSVRFSSDGIQKFICSRQGR
jgi:predicted DNA-binding transcriptional regulator AlpA